MPGRLGAFFIATQLHFAIMFFLMSKHCNSQELSKRGGIELTAHREIILNVFICAQIALSPLDILRQVRKRKSIDKVTLYRILDLFVAKRIIRRITSPNGPMRYEIMCQEHHPVHAHFVCRDCGGMECLDDFDLGPLRNSIQHKRKMKEGDIDLRLEGLCGQCREK